MEIYRIRELSFAFPQQETAALSAIDLSIRGGEFIALCGQSGCGKSTLLRHLKTVLTPHGSRSGEVLFRGRPLQEADQRTQAADIGFVFQSPDNQLVTDKVWHELAFGLESLGCDQRTIRLRVAEMASFFGIQSWFHKRVTELSGGQKQLLNLASIMVMQPSVLILDEPTSQLDPIAAADFLETVSKLNRELGTTVIMSEHRLEEVLPIADRLIVLDGGAVHADGPPAQAGGLLRSLRHPMFASMPAPMQIHAGVAGEGEGPLTVKAGRQWLSGWVEGTRSVSGRECLADQAPAEWSMSAEGRTAAAGAGAEAAAEAKAAANVSAATAAMAKRPAVIQFRDVWFRYDKVGDDTIKDLSLDIREGQFYCIVGGNGAGKTTALSLISGILRPYRGKVLVQGVNPARRGSGPVAVQGGLGALPQNPAALFVKKTVELDLYEMLSGTPLSPQEKRRKVDAVIRLAELERLLLRHPYDLSGGEQQRAALAKVLLLEPKILLLDEPTKGLDSSFKAKLGSLLRRLHEEGMTIVLVSHDIEFCAKYGEECAMFFDGSVMTSKPAKSFFAGNSFYTTAANRMARHIWSDAVTAEEVIELCRSSMTEAGV
ncbi:energy-coupling factor transport system ATP-binding protein [Paenibacillus sp. UNCCL117]|uniref:ABC transporter ATP-binding protein n=1 Tax=unclassified Paenibacillus TaxID=185978 RepID=UPI0008844361|nr:MULTISPECIES: ATP-binding cassette domain-containing protein [unclassified Paenibacillus]SDE10734.1 energy-coupling factor transport system ATP-binding protein [Paenibacillus sp. cl123]SFW59834.1 energy-coupling factor transport system ATP-binding protein [Paenibacillus sp. UNCCL117]